MLNFKSSATLHNRFDVVVEDIETGEIIQRFEAENMVLDNMLTALRSIVLYPIASRIIYGTGTGTLESARTTLFNRLGSGETTLVSKNVTIGNPSTYEIVYSYTIPADTHTGSTLSEVGLSYPNSTTNIVTHAFLEDSEGNPITVGPLTSTQQVTIYATIYASVSTADSGALPIFASNSNAILNSMTGQASVGQISGTASTSNLSIFASENKQSTNQAGPHTTTPGTSTLGAFRNHDAESKKSETNRGRFDTDDSNHKIWSLLVVRGNVNNPIMRILFPCDAYSGYQFINKAIGTGDGVTTEFSLPWSDINTTKAKTWYVNSVATAATITENTESSTKIQFASPPANNEPITGDWWVDYVPKDEFHVLDCVFSITYSWT